MLLSIASWKKKRKKKRGRKRALRYKFVLSLVSRAARSTQQRRKESKARQEETALTLAERNHKSKRRKKKEINMDVIKTQQISTRPIEKVIVHPLVLLSIVDNYNRVARDTRKRVVGVLLGTSFKGTVDVTNSYAGSHICFFF